MRITPLEIRQKTFEKAFRGLDKDEVQAFLVTLSQQWERMLEENKDLKMKLDATTREVQKMREVESSLYKTLKTAEDTGNNIMEQATKAAELHMRETQFKAEQMLNEARQQARTLIEDAYKQSERTISEMQQEVKSLEQEYQRMESYLDNLVRDLRNLATDALDKVEKSKAKPKASTSGILSRAANVQVKDMELTATLKEIYQTAPKNEPAPALRETPKAEPIAAEVNKAVAQNGGSEKYIPNSPVQNPQPMQPMQPATSPAPAPATSPDRNPAPDVNEPKPQIEQPTTPVPSIPNPEVERPKTDVPEIPNPEVEEPKPEIKPMPDKPEVQPPLTRFEEPARTKAPEKAMAGGGSFFDDFE